MLNTISIYNFMINTIEEVYTNLKILFFTSNNENKILYEIILLCGIPLFVNLFNYGKDKKLYNIFLNLNRTNRSTIIIEGKKCMRINSYSSKKDSLFSNRFIAFWYYINTNNLNNNDIFALKESSDEQTVDQEDDMKKKTYCFDTNIFIVQQTYPFLVSKDIYCKVYSKYENNESNNDKNNGLYIETITMELYSYKLNLNSLTKFLDIITQDYQNRLELLRNNKRFIYSYIGVNKTDKDINNNWDECEFTSSRTFKNLFFEDKNMLISKLDFFINNREWYDNEGHPYTLGVGLHGPPGTGKTSIIKCIANKLNRHIILIPLSKITTQKEFNECYFEKIYNRHNQKHIDFNDKIIVFEDIDCMSDIVKQRDNIEQVNTQENGTKNINNVLLDLHKKIDNNTGNIINTHENTDKITLSYILNVIDGIRETPNRILIITSNMYSCLDKALVRPGRIDITLELKNASRSTIKDMYNYYYNKNLDDETYNKIIDYKFSPAEIVNFRILSSNPTDFINKVLKY